MSDSRRGATVRQVPHQDVVQSVKKGLEAADEASRAEVHSSSFRILYQFDFCQSSNLSMGSSLPYELNMRFAGARCALADENRRTAMRCEGESICLNAMTLNRQNHDSNCHG